MIYEKFELLTKLRYGHFITVAIAEDSPYVGDGTRRILVFATLRNGFCTKH